MSFDDPEEPRPTDNPFERVPPQDQAAERGVLGSMMCDERAAEVADEALTPEDFYSPVNAILFKLFREVIRTQSASHLDQIILKSEIDSRGLTDRVGGVNYLLQLVQDTPTAANVERYIRILKERALERKLILHAHLIVSKVQTPGELKPSEILGQVEQDLYGLVAEAKGVSQEPVNLQDLADQIAHAALNDQRPRPGLKIGIADGAIDDMLGSLGLEPNQLIVVAARTSVGKTTFVLNTAMGIRRENPDIGSPLIISTEVSQWNMARTCLAACTGLHTRALALCNLTETQKLAVEKAIQNRPIDGVHAAYCPGKTIAQIRAMAKRHQARYGLPLLVIDLAGKLKGEGESEREQLSSISAGLGELKAELNTTVIACVQINRSVFASEDRRPELHHLKGSGAWEEDADMVWFLSRPGQSDPGSADPRTEIRIAKDRDHDRCNKSCWIEWKTATGQYIWCKGEEKETRHGKATRADNQATLGMDDPELPFGRQRR